MNEDNEWTYTIEDLDKYADGKEIEYTWTEENMPEGYELSDTTVNGYVTTLTNRHETAKIDLQVTKVWDDANNESGKRPSTITIVLLANSKYYDEVTLSEEVDWKHTFNNLPKFDNGEIIEYTLEEVDIPEGYVAACEGDMETGFIMHNFLGQGDHTPDNPYNNPQTGDNIVIYLISLLISMIGFIISKRYLNKYDC